MNVHGVYCTHTHTLFTVRNWIGFIHSGTMEFLSNFTKFRVFDSSNYYRYCLRRYNSITNKLALDCSTVLRLCFKTRQNTICTQRWWTCNDTSTINIQLGTICQLISETFAHHLIACLKVYALFRVVFTHKSKSFRLFSVKCKIPIWQMLYFNCTINGLENSNETKKKLQFLCKFPQ